MSHGDLKTVKKHIRLKKQNKIRHQVSINSHTLMQYWTETGGYQSVCEVTAGVWVVEGWCEQMKSGCSER